MTVKKAHARFSASSSNRWLSCPGSVLASEKVPPLPDSVYSIEGTRAHECLEYLMRNRHKSLSAREFLKQKYGLQMVIHAETALRYVEKRLGVLPGATLLIEQKCDLPTFEPNQYGTTDIAIVEPKGVLEVIDYKYGGGIPVFPTENSQLIYYAIGLAHRLHYAFQSVRLTIVQPRRPIIDPKRPTDSGAIRWWDTDIGNLKDWLESFEDGMAKAKKPDALLWAGDHCRFCAAKASCPEFKNAALRSAQDDFDDLVF